MKKLFSIGTRSVLYGAHCFFLHPFFVAWGWAKLWGFPWDPRLWVAFFLHDIGYLGKPNMDGPEGETHVEIGANLVHQLCDWSWDRDWDRWWDPRAYKRSKTWYHFSLCHSRHYSRKLNLPLSKLAPADKLAFCLEPAWLYLARVKWTGELAEYQGQIKWRGQNVGKFTREEYEGLNMSDPIIWHRALVSHTLRFMDQYMKDFRAGMNVPEVS